MAMYRRSICWLLLLLGLPIPAQTQAVRSDQYRQKAETLYEKGSYDRARFWYNQAYELVRHTDPVRAANLCVDLGSLDYMKEHARMATDRCLLGLRYVHASKSSPDSVRFKLYSSLGTYYTALLRKDSALYYFRRADALLTANPGIEAVIPLYVLYHFNNQGNWFFKLGNYARSLVFLAKAQEISQKYGSPDEMTYVESNLAGCYNATGDFDRALTHIRRAGKLHPVDDIQKWRYTVGTGLTLYNLKRYPEALRYFDEAGRRLRKLRRKATDYLPDQVNLWRVMSRCYRVIDQPEKADYYASQALALHRRYLGDRGSLFAQTLVEQGENHEKRRAVERAVSAYQAAIRAVCYDTARLTDYQQNPTPETTSDEATLLLAAVHKAAALKKQYDTTHDRSYLTTAVNTYRYCVQLQQRIRHGIDADQSQVIFSDHQHTLVPEALTVTFEAYQQQPSRALREILFQLFEQAQAGSLREAFQQNIIKPQTIPGPMLEQEQKLKKQISRLRKQAVSDSSVRVALTQVQLQWHQLVERFRQDYPAYYQRNYQNPTMSSHALQQALGEETAYLAYVRRGASLFILVVTRQAVEVVRQPIDSTRLSRQLTGLNHELYRNPILGQYKGALYASGLYAVCLEPVRKFLTRKTRLIISRDWSFHFLPFEVLETGRQARDYLARHVAIAYAFSAQTFFDVRQRPPSSNSPLVVAPFARASTLLPSVYRGASAQTLASSEVEARNIGGDLLVGRRASLTAFLRTNLDRPVIYFATHAKTDDDDPTNSYIAFSPYEGGKLYVDDIYNLSLSSTGLVVLGACETGAGRTMKGEGILSLARAFAYAGCPAVITTLWSANDETTSFLTIRLHHYLSQGMPTDQALQRARSDFFGSPRFPKYDHPYYWANYTLMGNYRPVMPEGSFRLDWWLLLGLVVGAGLFWQRTRLVTLIRRRLLPGK